MRLNFCDKCGKSTGLPYKVKIIEPVNGNEFCSFEICVDCAKKLQFDLTRKRDRLYQKKVGKNEN